jgi:tetratricopeptide (TPR) repeat protein
MIKAVLYTFCLLFPMIVTLSGCAALPPRNDTTHPQPAPLALRPDGAAFHYSLGVLLAMNGNLEEAIQEMEKAHNLDPASPFLAKEIASLYMEKGETKKALTICKKILEEHPNDIDTLLLLGDIYLHMKDYRSGADQYQRVVDLDPNNVTL